MTEFSFFSIFLFWWTMVSSVSIVALYQIKPSPQHILRVPASLTLRPSTACVSLKMSKGHLWNKLCLFSSSRPGEKKKKIEGLLNQGVTRLKREEARGLNEVDKAIWKLIPPVERCRAGLLGCNSPHAFIHFSSCWDAEYVRCFSAWSMNWSPRRGARRSPASRCHKGSGSGIHLQWNIICDLPREALEKCIRRQRVILCFYVSEARGDWSGPGLYHWFIYHSRAFGFLHRWLCISGLFHFERLSVWLLKRTLWKYVWFGRRTVSNSFIFHK